MVEQKISLDFVKNGVQRTVHARQGENAARDILISLTANGEPVDVSEYILWVIYPDTTHSVLETDNPVKVTIPQQMCVTTGEKVCEIQVKHGGNLLYSPQFRVLVEGTILGASGSSEPIGLPTTYEPNIAANAAEYTGTLDGVKIPVIDPVTDTTKWIGPDELQSDVTELEEDVASLKRHLQEGDYTAPTIFRATATISQGKITEVTLDNGKTMGDVFLIFSRGTPAYIDVHDNNDTEMLLATFKGYWGTEDDSGFVFEGEYVDSTIMLVAPTDEDEDTLTCIYNPEQLQSDWNQSDTTAKDFIKNKPNITAPVQPDWSESDSTALDFIKNKPTIVNPVQSDWNQADSSALDYIKNKPSIPSIAGLEETANKVTSLSAQSTDTQYPSAKCIYDLIGGLDDLIGTGVIS